MTIDRVGFPGLGAMGSRMAVNLVARGFDLVGFDIAGTAARLPPSATAASSANGVGEAVDVVLLSLPDGGICARPASATSTEPGGDFTRIFPFVRDER